MNCTRCQGTGFLNLEQVPDEVLNPFNATGDVDLILAWIDETAATRNRYGCSCHINPPCHTCVEYTHDVQVCDCCGNGEHWHEMPGEHNGWADGKEPIPQCI